LFRKFHDRQLFQILPLYEFQFLWVWKSSLSHHHSLDIGRLPVTFAFQILRHEGQREIKFWECWVTTGQVSQRVRYDHWSQKTSEAAFNLWSTVKLERVLTMSKDLITRDLQIPCVRSFGTKRNGGSARLCDIAPCWLHLIEIRQAENFPLANAVLEIKDHYTIIG
jgi:hypothetical protein